MKSDKNRDFAKNPRTKEESVGLILKAIKDDKLIGGCISYLGYHCALGHLLTQNQRNYLFKHNVSDSSVEDIAKVVGRKNLKAMTGLNYDELDLLVVRNDTSTYSLKVYLKELSPKSFKEC